ncbi:MAG TPA: hypothetical protein VJ691_08580 [Vicinamibacterales bacterium]|nr:hypothetical protein [Vicinamibacterales bacterium]
MVPVLSLLIPIVVSAVFVFIASSIIHMATPLHKNDIRKFPNEDAVRNALRPLNLAPGDYGVPVPASMKDMNSPEFLQKYREGPVAFITVRPSGQMTMTGSLVKWFIYSLVVSLFAGYVAGAALPPGTDYLKVFQVTGAVAFTGYALGLAQFSIWYGRSWATTVRSMADGLLYGLLTAGVFGWLWPR